MTLGMKQEIFSLNLALLLLYAYQHGYRVRMGETWRSPTKAGENAAAGIGIANSLHTLKLAADLNLFKDGVFLTKTEDHRPLGEYWESLHVDNRWGGRFDDGNHYSMTHGGVM